MWENVGSLYQHGPHHPLSQLVGKSQTDTTDVGFLHSWRTESKLNLLQANVIISVLFLTASISCRCQDAFTVDLYHKLSYKAQCSLPSEQLLAAQVKYAPRPPHMYEPTRDSKVGLSGRAARRSVVVLGRCREQKYSSMTTVL